MHVLPLQLCITMHDVSFNATYWGGMLSVCLLQLLWGCSHWEGCGRR